VIHRYTATTTDYSEMVANIATVNGETEVNFHHMWVICPHDALGLRGRGAAATQRALKRQVVRIGRLEQREGSARARGGSAKNLWNRGIGETSRVEICNPRLVEV